MDSLIDTMAWRSRLICVLRHPRRPAVLLMRSDRAWGPPRTMVAKPLWPGSAEEMVGALESRLGARVWINRPLRFRMDRDKKLIETVLDAEIIDDSWSIPGNGRWVGREELPTLRLREESLRGLLESHLGSFDSVDDRRSPWNRPDWLAGVRQWLDELPIGNVTEIAQIKQWGISNVLKVSAAGDTYFFKVSATLPLFVNEALVVPALSELLPDFVAAPAAVDEDRGWVLSRDLGDVDEEPTPAGLEDFFRSAARMHIVSAPLVDALSEAGCVDRRLEILPSQFGEVVADDRVMSRLDPADRDLLMTIDVAELCRQLSGCGFPTTLVHGDLHPGNAVIDGEAMFVFDWSDASISHPLFDLHLLDRMARVRGVELEGAYLELWEGRVAPEARQAASRLARILRPLHHAVSYRSIASGLEEEARPELDFAHEFLAQAAEAFRADGMR